MMETVDAKEWVVLGTRGGAALMEEIPGGKIHRLPPGLLPDDVRRGDSFRLVARLDRRADGALEHPGSGEARRVLEEG